MSLFGKLRSHIQEHTVTLDLDDIQATVLRLRPEPYFGTHFLLHFRTPESGRGFIRRVAPHIASAEQWWNGDHPWTAVALSYAGLEALDVPRSSLQSFPEGFRVGMAARATQLLDTGPNDPKRWDKVFREEKIHAALTVFAPSEASWRETATMLEEQFRGTPGLSIVGRDDFGAQPGSRNSLGYKDLISNPAIEGSGVTPFPGQGPAIKAGEFVLGYPGEAGIPLPMPQPDVLGRNGTFVAFRKYHTRAGSFNRFLRDNASDEESRELLAAKLVGRWRSGAPLTLAPEQDDPDLGADPHRNNDFQYKHDPDGLQVPAGSHMRRMNPRDSEMQLMADVNLHRIIRRATAFGPAYDADAITFEEDAVERGLHFIFMSARAMETVEFLQRNWINKGEFVGLGDERDPIIGVQEPQLTFTIPKTPVRTRVHGMDTFNELKGGEYFFMPGLAALAWLGQEH
ncbi:peroxidase [Microbacterium sp. KSW4-16]|uniref:Dyp-type peroxidase n=1 Tax=Microbacterium aurugineum TaxID=2851642 RepID=UPI0020BD7515|nr:peroxidase [Microbacterium aurugineum]MCK8469057.1 peroxidase [Microbacterium aurugineum]